MYIIEKREAHKLPVLEVLKFYRAKCTRCESLIAVEEGEMRRDHGTDGRDYPGKWSVVEKCPVCKGYLKLTSSREFRTTYRLTDPSGSAESYDADMWKKMGKVPGKDFRIK